MTISTKYRTDLPEMMDDFAMTGEELQEALDKIAQINHFLGGNKITVNGVKKLIFNQPSDQMITIVDVGCGNGDMLRALADFGLKNNFKFDLIGIDANQFTVDYAQDLSEKYSNISFKCLNVFDESFYQMKCDILLCTLTLHHFKDKEILHLLDSFYQNARLGIVINDLQRSKLSYQLFKVLCWVFRLGKMNRDDGLVSILRGFKRKDLEDFSRKLNFKKYSIRWKWAFRYQWIIVK